MLCPGHKLSTWLPLKRNFRCNLRRHRTYATPRTNTNRSRTVLSRACTFVAELCKILINAIYRTCDATMWTQRIRTINRRPRLTTLECSQFSVWDVKEPTHYSQSVGHGAPGVVVWPSAMWSAWCNLRNGLLIDETT